MATLLVEVCAKPLRRRALPCASVSPSRPSRPPGMSTGKEASVPSDAAATDRLNGSVGAAAKRPRDSEGSHHLRWDGRGTRRSHRERPSTPPAAGAGAERYGGPASNPKAEALSENLGCAHAHGCCESSEAELARRELLELITAPDADVGGAIKLLFSQPRTSSSRRTRAVAWHLEYDSGEDASARVLFHRAAQAGSPLLLAGAPLPPDVGDGAFQAITVRIVRLPVCVSAEPLLGGVGRASPHVPRLSFTAFVWPVFVHR